MRHLDPLALFHFAVAHETDTQQREFDILTGIAGLFLAAVKGVDLLFQEACPPGKRGCLHMISLPTRALRLKAQ